MRRKRFRSVLAFILALSMIFGSNASILADEVSDNTAPVEETVGQPPASEEIQEPGAETPVSENEGEEPVTPGTPVQEEKPAGEAPADETPVTAVSDDTADEVTVSENKEVPEEEVSANESEEAAGAVTEVKLFVSGNTVSYNGEDHGITVSSNVKDGYEFIAWLISANDTGRTDPSQYTETDYTTGPGAVSANLTKDISSSPKKFFISNNSAVNASRYAVSVNVLKDGKVSANAVVFLSVNKAEAISLSINGKTKYYDGSDLLPGNDIYEVNDKKLYTNAIENKNDIELVKISGSQKDAGESYIKLDASAISANYASVTVSAGKLTVLSTNLVIRSKSFRKNYDKKKVTEEQRRGFTIEAAGADVKTLSSNLKLDVNDFAWDPTSLISGDEVTVSQNKFALNDSGKTKINGSNNGKNFASVKLVSGNISIVRHDWKSNDLTAPVISSIKLNKKGFVTIKWKAAKTYKYKGKKDSKKSAAEKKMDQARYMIYRYDAVNEDWILLNGANKSKAKDKESDRTYGQTGTKFTDKQAGREGQSTYIYKVNVIGYDRNQEYGMAKEYSYKACAPMALTLSTKQHDPASLDLRFSKIRGTETYVIERSLTGKKNDFDDKTISVSADKIDSFEYYGTKLASPLTYKNNGEPVKSGVIVPAEGVYITDRQLDTDTKYYYRAYVKSSVVEFGEDGAVLPDRKTVESGVSNVLNAKCKPYAPYVVSAGTARYNQAVIAFEKLSDDIIPIGTGKSYSKNKYEILRSTDPTTGFKVVATITGKDLSGEVSGLAEMSANKAVSMNGVQYPAQSFPTYVYLMKGLAPEITYYYRVRVVLDKVNGVQSDSIAVKPMMGDVSSISANVDNYNAVTITTDYVTGAKQMVISYRATMTHKGKALSENSNKDSKWKRKTFTIEKDKNKDPITKFKIEGLKHGYTYVFYAEPKNGKKHVAKNPKTVTATTKVGAPKLTTTPKDMDEVYVSWQEVKGATKYRLRIYDIENNNNKVVDKTFKKPGKHTWKGGSIGSLDPKKGKTDMDLVGKPYRFEVSAYRKDSYFSDGEWGLTASKTDSGRPTGVKDLKAQVNKVQASEGYTFYPDAYLTWNHSADFSQSTPLTYMVERRVYKYKTGTDDSFNKNYTTSTIISKKDAYKKLKKKDGKYTSYKSCRSKEKNVPFYHGDKVVYVITPVYYSETAKAKGRGPEKDGYILGVAKKVTYVTPAKIVLKRTEVTVGSSAQVPISYLPKSTTVKDVVWTAPSQKYFTFDGTKVKGKTAMTKWNNDVYVLATGRITISGSKITSNKALIKVNAKAVKDGELKVCIDAGHGGSDSGATNGDLKEKSCNLDMANAMKSELEAYGVPVVMTRYDDSYISVGDRPNIAYSNGCNLFISIHCNSGGGNGTEVWKSVTEYHDDALANKILSKVTGALGTGNRGVKTRTGSNGDYYGVIRGSAAKKITGMIVEVAFIDGDYSKLNSYNNRKAAGKAIADAVLESRGYK